MCCFAVTAASLRGGDDPAADHATCSRTLFTRLSAAVRNFVRSLVAAELIGYSWRRLASGIAGPSCSQQLGM